MECIRSFSFRKYKFPLISSFIIISCLTACVFQAKLFHSSSNLKAICREDNDFVTNNDTTGNVEMVPEKVASVIKVLIDSIKEYDTPPEYTKILDCIYKVRMTPLISLYITKVSVGLGYPIYYIIGYNAGTDIATNHPPYIDGNFMENNEEGFVPIGRLLQPPLISFEDINDDGQKEIKVKERAHNGTMYNAEVDDYYDIDDSMHLHDILSVESKSMDTFDDTCMLYRTLKNSILYDTLKCQHSKPVPVGQVLLQINLHSRIISKKADDSAYKYILINSNPNSDSDSL